MQKSTRLILTIISSLLLLGVGLFRFFTESLSPITLFVTNIFVITGLIGSVANGILLIKLKVKSE